MSHGSFRYRQRIRQKIRMKRVSSERGDGLLKLNFEDEKTGKKASLVITGHGGLARVAYEGPGPEEGIDRFWIGMPAEEDEHIYGCGEIHARFDLKGEKVRIWVAEHQNALRISDKLIRQKIPAAKNVEKLPFWLYESYYAQPTFMSSGMYFVHADVTRYAEFDFRGKDKTVLFFNEPPVFYVGRSRTWEGMSGKLFRTLGGQPELPDWIYDGAILAVQEGTETVERKLAAAEKAGIPVCGIWSQDWCGCRRTGFGYQVMWNWEWDKELYPDLPEKIRAWKEKGVRFLGYINPFLALEGPLYREAAEKGYCVKDKDGKDYLVKITTFPAAMVDLTNPAAYAWYQDIIRKNMIGLGMGGWMADFGEYLPVDCVLYSGEDPAAVHNTWPAVWARLNKEVVIESGRRDIFYFTRAGFTGSIQDSPMMWTGDHHVDWSADDGLGAVIPATLSLAMSGCGVTHSDAGGYTTVMDMTRSRELLMRWEELCAFSPLYRTHEGNQPSRNAQFDADEETLRQTARTARMHLALKDYLKECVRENAEKGLPVMRPVFYHYDEAWFMTDRTEYLLGRDILAAPVLKEGETSREVMLPEDSWVCLLTGEACPPGRVRMPAPIGFPPVFIRKDSPWAEKLLTAFRDI